MLPDQPKSVKTEEEEAPGKYMVSLLYNYTLPVHPRTGTCFPGSFQVVHLGKKWDLPGRCSLLLLGTHTPAPPQLSSPGEF